MAILAGLAQFAKLTKQREKFHMTTRDRPVGAGKGKDLEILASEAGCPIFKVGETIAVYDGKTTLTIVVTNQNLHSL